METEQWWYFTFTGGQPERDNFVKIYGTFKSARSKMCEKYGTSWAFQYSEDNWEDQDITYGLTEII